VISDASTVSSSKFYTVAEVMEMPLDKLQMRVFSPRLSLNYASVKRLSVDLARRGQLTPIKVQEPAKKSDLYKVIDGDHRVAAARMAELAIIRAEILTISDEDAYAFAIISNKLGSRTIETLELAFAVSKQHGFGRTEIDIADRLGFSQAKVSLLLTLAEKSTPELREAVITRVITPRTAMSLASFPAETQLSVSVIVKNSEVPLGHREILRIARGDPEPDYDFRCKCGRLYQRKDDRLIEVE
jgi:ParB/RepB/Spo0J family partition protein